MARPHLVLLAENLHNGRTDQVDRGEKDRALEEMAEEAEQASSHKLSHPTIGVPRGDRIFVVMYFEIIGDIRQPETIAVGTGFAHGSA